MDNITEITTIVEDGSKRPLAKLQKATKFMAVLQAFLAELQELETAIIATISARYIANAIGWQLDQTGKLVGRPRPAYGPAVTDDNAYRALVYAQIAANTSSGMESNVLGLLGALQTGDPHVYDVYPAAIVINYQPTPLINSADMRDILMQTKAPVAMDISEHTDQPFGFLGDGGAFGFDEGQIGGSG